MGRLRRFEEHRFLGTRDDMVVYDCDDDEQFAALEERFVADDLLARNLISAVAPDTLAEARNRGFEPAVIAPSGVDS
ncbi:MAG: hypothetical protein HKN74_07680 [Acidimicrobiia bacterium]|nr:hypothetical protein [Acidimicrobiia bacterium]NNF10147.1 hypothetical protein [Acidimicrobiia bacterium]NNL70569.1 hypothetical protein [Acidimicrobiia bacterium]